MSEPIRVPWGAWFGDEELALPMPASWEARLFPPRNAPELSDEALRQSFEAPYGTPRLRELARGRRDAVIVVDDLSRPTPAARREARHDNNTPDPSAAALDEPAGDPVSWHCPSVPALDSGGH